MNIVNESLPDGFRAGNGTVGTTEAKISEIDWPVRKHVVIRAAKDNSGTIHVGPPGNAAAGFVLAAGQQTPPLFVDNTTKVRLIGSAADQSFSWLSN